MFFSLLLSHLISVTTCIVTVLVFFASVHSHAITFAQLESEVLDFLIFFSVKLVAFTIVALIATATLDLSFVDFARVLFVKLSQFSRHVSVCVLESCN